MNNEILEGLTPEQQKAVTHSDGPLLVIAGAGAGKTRVITRRVAWLCDSGVSPYEILGITFTNKAAREMRERIQKWIDSPRMWLFTFHSTCARILRREIGRIPPFDSNFSIVDETDRIYLIRDICHEVGIDGETYKPSELADEISDIKNRIGVGIEPFGPSGISIEMLDPLYTAYEKALAGSNSLDFDDLLVKTVKLFDDEPSILDRYRRRFVHVLVDEYQDTNPVQNLFLKQLCAPSSNICATGDPDQAIYGWRGADISNILNFENDFENTVVVTLAKNFRSTNSILRLANTLIEKNEQRYHKNLFSDFGEGEKAMLLVARDDEDEAIRIVDRIKEYIYSGASEPGECAILVRINAQTRQFEEACRHRAIPYSLVGAVAFFRRKEIKDLTAYLKVLVNPTDSLSLLRIINRPSRGIGPTTVEVLQKLSDESSRPVFDLVQDSAVRNSFAKRPAYHLEGFAAILERLSKLPRKPVAPLVRAVIEESGYAQQYDPRKRQTDVEQIANIGEFINDAVKFDEQVGGDLIDFLQQIALISDVDNADETGGAVTIMTYHAAKGLEFTNVFLAGLEEGLLPHERSMKTPDQIEEERRLFYVGITRAKRHLTVSYCMRRRIYGEFKETRPSRFLRDSELLTFGTTATRIQAKRTGQIVNFDLDAFRKKGVDVKDTKNGDNSLNNTVFEVGDIIEHAQFGSGRIESISGRGPNAKLRIYFRHYGVKVMLLEFARPKLVIRKKSR